MSLDMADKPRTHRQKLLLVASDDAGLVERLTAALPTDVQVRWLQDAAEVMELVTNRPLAGAVLDIAFLGRHALSMATTFLTSQARGRVILLEEDSGDMTQVGISLRDTRTQCISRPVSVELLLERLGLQRAPMAMR